MHAQKVKKQKINDPILGKVKVVKSFDEDGKLYKEEKYYKDVKKGKVTSVKTWHYKNDKQYLQSESEEYYTEKGKQVVIHKQYFLYYTAYGKLKSLTHYVDHIRNGEQLKFHRNGELLSRYNYVKGLKKGVFKEYHDNKQLGKNGNYNAKSKLEGKLVTYNIKGQLEKDLFYTNGKVTKGSIQKYNKRGDLIKKCVYSEKYIDCEIRTYADDDDTNYGAYEYETAVYNERRKKGEKSYRAYNHGLFKTFYRNRKLQTEGVYEKGVKTGVWISYDKKGRKISECNYLNDTLVKCKKRFFYKDKLFLEQFTVNKLLEGAYTRYHKGTRLLEETGFYKNDKYHGIIKKYRKKGVLYSEREYDEGELRLHKRFFYNGQLHMVVNYENNKMYNVLECYNLKGEKLNFGTLKNGEGTLKFYDLETGLYKKTIKLEK